MQLTRRAFIRSAVVACAFPSLAAQCRAKVVRLTVSGDIIRLPAKGRLFIANDFHSRYGDFARWLAKTDLVNRLSKGEDVYGLVLGDAVDVKRPDPEALEGDDSRIINRIRQIQGMARGERLIYILGNHEYECVRIYEALKEQAGMTPRNRAQIIRALYASTSGEYFQQFNFIERMTDEQCAYLKRLPLGVISDNGLVCVHAGPARLAKTAEDLVRTNEKVLDELLWSRPTDPYDHKETPPLMFDATDTADFLKRMEDASLLVLGHTPLPALPEKWIRNGIGCVGEHGVIMAASFGAMPDKKQYLSLDLATRYRAIDGLRAGQEIVSNQ